MQKKKKKKYDMHDLRKEAVALSFSNPNAIFTAAKPHITILEPGTGFLKPGKSRELIIF